MDIKVGSIGNGNTISGDGIVGGVGNKIDNRVTHNHRAPGPGNESGDPVPMLGLGVLIVLAIMMVAYYFSLYANFFYAVVTCLAALQASFPLLSYSFALWHRQKMEQPWRGGLVFVLSGALTYFSFITGLSYPEKLIDIAAKAATARGFWCSLNDYGQMVSAQHALSAILLTGSLVLLVPHTMRSLAENVSDPGSRFYNWAAASASWPKLSGAAVLATASWALITFTGPYLQEFLAAARFVVCKGP